MSGRYDIELSEPRASRCDCCGGLTVALTRFVHRDGHAFAVYYAAYSNNHPENELVMMIALGDWGEDTDPAQRVAFYCRVRPTPDSYDVMLEDAARSRWAGAGILGRKLSQEEARAHDWKGTAFEVLDEAFLRDPSLSGFIKRAQCGDIAAPLERAFAMPDDIFAIGDARETRARLTRNFASLDERRFFVRCILPIPVEGYGDWGMGVWVEVSWHDYERVHDAWNDAERYRALCFTGTLANDIAADLAQPMSQRIFVELHVPDSEHPPMVRQTTDASLRALLSSKWQKSAFESFALARGIL